MPRSSLKAVGPMGRSADHLVGRPSQGANHPQLLGVGLSWALACLISGVWPVLTGFASVLGLHLAQLSLNRRSNIFCDFMSGQSVLANCVLAQKHNLHFLEGEVWFRDFIR